MNASIDGNPSVCKGFKRFSLFVLLLAGGLGVAGSAAPTAGQENRDQLIERLRALHGKAESFGPSYQPLYLAALPWYETWGGHTNDPADQWMVAPEEYAAELAAALERGSNYIAENPGGSFPLTFQKKLPDGRIVSANYLLSLPADFPKKGRKSPLIIGLHGSGWLGHRISYSRGGKTGGRAFQVTPINEAGPWRLDFLNAYLDELLTMLPIDPDKVYVEGHSLGAMATWDWAMNNPERFAAISPRDGTGAAFRAARLKNVPVWVIHGSEDDTILPGYAEQMVTALQRIGGTVKYSLLKGAPHNLPPDFDQQAVIDWYLQQTRSHQPAPADPLDALGIGPSGFSEVAMVALPEGSFWKSESLPLPGSSQRNAPNRAAEKMLFKRIEDRGGMVDSPIREEIDPESRATTLWLAVPKALQSQVQDDPSIVKWEHREGARFYARADTQKALEHAKEMSAKLKSEGRALSEKVWRTPLTPSRRGTNNIAEYWVELK